MGVFLAHASKMAVILGRNGNVRKYEPFMIVFSTIQKFALKLVNEYNSSNQAKKKAHKAAVKRNCSKLIQGKERGGKKR